MLAHALTLTALCILAADPPATPSLPPPFDTPAAVKYPTVVGWPEGKTPAAPAGYTVTLFAKDLDRPRWLYVLPNGDVLVAEARTEKIAGVLDDKKREGLAKSKLLGKSANRITLLRDADADGTPELRETFLSGLNQPFGMVLLGDQFLVANTDGVMRYGYKPGATSADGPGTLILGLPAGGYNNHWTRNLVVSPDGQRLFVTVGSQTNVNEDNLDAKEPRRATILTCDLDGLNMRVYASGLRNPNGLDFEPATGKLWTAVNERDDLGDELVPDYVTSIREGGFYGWPYAYFGPNEDPRQAGLRPDLVAKSIVPDVAVGSHTASLGLAFCRTDAFGPKYQGGLFIGQRGSWNRSEFAGYRVAFLPFKDGNPSGPLEDFLTGFVKNDDEVHGQPVGVAFAKDGSLLVADDSGNCIWRVTKGTER